MAPAACRFSTGGRQLRTGPSRFWTKFRCCASSSISREPADFSNSGSNAGAIRLRISAWFGSVNGVRDITGPFHGGGFTTASSRCQPVSIACGTNRVKRDGADLLGDWETCAGLYPMRVRRSVVSTSQPPVELQWNCRIIRCSRYCRQGLALFRSGGLR